MVESSLDIEFDWQGLYLSLLKVPRFDTDGVFDWVTNVSDSQRVNFSGTLYSHFLIRCENAKISTIKNQNDFQLVAGSLEVVDCISPKQFDKPENLDDSGYGNRVDIQGLDCDPMNMSMSFNNSDIFKSAIEFDTNSALNACKEVFLLRLVPASVDNTQTVPHVVKVKLDLTSIPVIAVNIHKVMVNFDLESFKLMTDRKAIYDYIFEMCQTVNSEKRRGQNESHRLNEARLLFDGVNDQVLASVVCSLKRLLECLKDDHLRETLLAEWKITLPHMLTKVQSTKIELNVTNFEAKVGGMIDAFEGKSSHVLLKTGCIKVVHNKSILVSWTQPIEVAIETETGKHTVINIVGDKQTNENVVGIDESCMVVKISTIEVRLSPAIFEGLLMLVQFIGSKLDRLEFNHHKYQIVPMLLALIDQHNNSYVLFNEELEINKLLRVIQAKLYEAPDMIGKAYVYIGNVELKIYDEEITKDIIESSIAQRKRMHEEFGDWTIVDDDATARPFQEKLAEDIEDKERRLKSLNVVIHLELKPIMFKQYFGPKPSMMLFIHTIMLQDGLTFISMNENRQNYATHFCELYSINYNQPSYDAQLKNSKFEIMKCIGSFNQILRLFKKEKPFLEVTQELGIDTEYQRPILKTKVEVSSIVFRLAMSTSKETFACLIRIIDSTLWRLDNISLLFMKLREANTTEEMKVYHRLQTQRLQSQPHTNVSDTGSLLKVNFDSIYLDVFNETSYRLIFKVKNTEVRIDDNLALNQPIQIECNLLQAAFALTDEEKRCKSVTGIEDKVKFFKVLNLLTMIVKITQPRESGVATTDVEVLLPTKDGRNLLLMIDIESMSVIKELLETFSSLIQHSKNKTKFIFKDLTEYKFRQPDTPLRKEFQEWEKVGQKLPEIQAIRDQFKILSGQVTESFMNDDKAKDEKAEDTSEEAMTEIKEKLDSTQRFLRELFVEKLPEKVSNLNIRVFVDKITINVYQDFNHDVHSYVSMKICQLIAVANISGSSLETSRKSEKTFTTTSVIVSARSFKVLDKTVGSMFKYLLKVPHHSLCLFFRNRVVAEKTVKSGIEIFKPTYVIESFNDRLGLVVDLNPIQINLYDKSVDSLEAFTERLLIIFKAKPPEEVIVISERKESSMNLQEKGPDFLLDYICINDLSLQLQARSATNLSVINFVPDINITIEVGFA